MVDFIWWRSGGKDYAFEADRQCGDMECITRPRHIFAEVVQRWNSLRKHVKRRRMVVPHILYSSASPQTHCTSKPKHSPSHFQQCSPSHPFHRPPFPHHLQQTQTQLQPFPNPPVLPQPPEMLARLSAYALSSVFLLMGVLAFTSPATCTFLFGLAPAPAPAPAPTTPAPPRNPFIQVYGARSIALGLAFLVFGWHDNARAVGTLMLFATLVGVMDTGILASWGRRGGMWVHGLGSVGLAVVGMVVFWGWG